MVTHNPSPNLGIRFDPLDPDQVHLLSRLSHELGFKFVEEIELTKQTRPGP